MNARMLSGTNHTKLNMKAAIIRKKTPNVENVGRPLTVGQTSLGLREFMKARRLVEIRNMPLSVTLT